MSEITPAMAKRIEVWPIARLVPYERNARTHSREQVAQLAASIVEFGFNAPILVDSNAGIIAGHGRFAAAQKLGLTEVPVVVLDHLTDTQRRAYIIADNKLAENAGWNEELLASELQAIAEEGLDLGTIGFDDKELAALLSDEVPEPPARKKKAPEQATGEGLVARCRSVADMDALREFLESRGIPFEEQSAPEHNIVKLTLVRPSWNKKRTVRFLSIRKWSARHHQEAVEAMKFAKARLDEQVLTQAASEVAGAVRDMGILGGVLVTAPPAGASPVDRHFGTELAKRVASELGVEYVNVFEPRPRGKKSHPRHYAERGEIKLLPGAPKGAYLLVDDVCSTGHTIENCVHLLCEQGTALAVAWIYEEAA